MKRMIGAVLVISLLWPSGCGSKPPAQTVSPAPAETSGGVAVSPSGGDTSGRVVISFPFNRQAGIATNQFAVWIENADGTYVKTLFATKFTAGGGYKNRKEAVKTWVDRSKLASEPHEDADAVSGATPKTGELSYTWDLSDYSGKQVPEGTYKFFVEGTLFWESSVIYGGEIKLKHEKSIVTPEAQYSSQDEKNRGMIGPVTAEYIP